MDLRLPFGLSFELPQMGIPGEGMPMLGNPMQMLGSGASMFGNIAQNSMAMEQAGLLPMLSLMGGGGQGLFAEIQYAIEIGVMLAEEQMMMQQGMMPGMAGIPMPGYGSSGMGMGGMGMPEMPMSSGYTGGGGYPSGDMSGGGYAGGGYAGGGYAGGGYPAADASGGYPGGDATGGYSGGAGYPATEAAYTGPMTGSAARLNQIALMSKGQRLWAETPMAGACQGGNLGCAASVMQVLKEAGYGYVTSGSVDGVTQQLMQHGWSQSAGIQSARPGDVIYGKGGGDNEHIGIVGMDHGQLVVFDNWSSDGRWHEEPLATSCFTHQFSPGQIRILHNPAGSGSPSMSPSMMV